jgi:hypothetical protein
VFEIFGVLNFEISSKFGLTPHRLTLNTAVEDKEEKISSSDYYWTNGWCGGKEGKGSKDYISM